MLSPTRLYTYLTQSRARVLDWIRPLTPDEYSREFEIGPGSLARTLNHMLIAEWYYIVRMLEGEVPPIDELIERDEHPPAFPELESRWAEQAEITRSAIDRLPDWHAPITYAVEREGAPVTVHTNPADIFTQLAFHEIHHRAQVLNILRRLGVTVEDIDFNLLMYRFEDG